MGQRKDKRSALRKEREEKQAKRVLTGIAVGAIVVAAILIIAYSLM